MRCGKQEEYISNFELSAKMRESGEGGFYRSRLFFGLLNENDSHSHFENDSHLERERGSARSRAKVVNR